jgi:hypothetical protein
MALPGMAPGGVAAAAPSFDAGHLLSLCSGLGGVRELPGGGAAYVRDDDALDCLVDIQRFLRRDDPATRDVVRQLADWSTLRGHVVPLMCTYSANFDLLFNATKARACLRLRVLRVCALSRACARCEARSARWTLCAHARPAAARAARGGVAPRRTPAAHACVFCVFARRFSAATRSRPLRRLPSPHATSTLIRPRWPSS